MDIYDYLSGRYESVKIQGNDIVMPCPFHDDHAPGHFYMDRTSGIWHCFHASCDLGGSFKSFMTRVGQQSYLEHIDFSPEDKEPLIDQTVTILEESVIGAYVKQLPTQLLNQGFSRTLLKKKQVGVDLIRYRITFPIRNHQGSLVGISGRRIFDDPSPRYKFYVSELRGMYPTYEFDKSKYLYNLEDVYPRVLVGPRKQPKIIIVEGFKACLWMLQCGYQNTVALMGSSMSHTQLQLLSRISSDFILFLDNDPGGFYGTIVAGEKLSDIGMVQIIRGGKKQPDDYSAEEIQTLMNDRINYAQFYLDNIKEISKLNIKKGKKYYV